MLVLAFSLLRAAANQPLSLKDLCLMLRGGFTEAEILCNTTGCPLLEPIDATAEKALLQAGASAAFIATFKASHRSLSDQEAAAARERQADQARKDRESRLASQARLQEIQRQAAATVAAASHAGSITGTGSLGHVSPAAQPNAGATAVDAASIKPDQIEVHDVLQNDSLPIGKGQKLAVIWDSGVLLSISLVSSETLRRTFVEPGVGPIFADYPKIHNIKVPKTNPIRLPGISNNAYLIHHDNEARYYFIDVIVKNGGAFRIAKVATNP